MNLHSKNPFIPLTINEVRSSKSWKNQQAVAKVWNFKTLWELLKLWSLVIYTLLEILWLVILIIYEAWILPFSTKLWLIILIIYLV